MLFLCLKRKYTLLYHQKQKSTAFMIGLRIFFFFWDKSSRVLLLPGEAPKYIKLTHPCGPNSGMNLMPGPFPIHEYYDTDATYI